MSRVVFVVVLVALFIIAYRCSLPREDGAPSSQATPPPAPIRLEDLPEFLRVTQAPRIIPTPRPDATWEERIRLSGTETTRSEPFELGGGLVRLRYMVEGSITLLAISVAPADPERLGAFPDVVTTQVGAGERLLTRAAGAYHLIVQTTSSNWTISVEEELP